jgi:ubiquinone/menaquinone biosynthesis C-methylase UbiE
MSLKRRVISQFGLPHGALGHVVGWMMANTGPNADRSRMTVEGLVLEPHSRVLEIGFGPGLAIKQAAELTPDGFVAGLEASKVMLGQARRRNRRAISGGRVDLRHGSVSTIPDFGGAFDVVFAVNSLHHWPDVSLGLSEVLRVLSPGGSLIVTEQPRSPSANAEVVANRAEVVTGLLQEAGFRDVAWELMPLEPVDAAVVRGTR